MKRRREARALLSLTRRRPVGACAAKDLIARCTLNFYGALKVTWNENNNNFAFPPKVLRDLTNIFFFFARERFYKMRVEVLWLSLATVACRAQLFERRSYASDVFRLFMLKLKN